MSSPIDTANQQQRAASDPAVSTFVSASAGSGKTKLLTDRILRLLLNGTSAQKILCLTYTKAAAAEMTIRLNDRLGSWVVMPDAQLREEFIAIDVPITDRTIMLARQLFGQILDLPDGMKISTIHAFCQSVLKKFPLEAKLSPHFQLENENDTPSRRRDAREHTLGHHQADDDIYSLASETNEFDFVDLVDQMLQDNRFQILAENIPLAKAKKMQSAILRAPSLSTDELRDRQIDIPRVKFLRQCLSRILDAGTPSGKTWASNCLSWLAQNPQDRLQTWTNWRQLFFTQAGSRRDLKSKLGTHLSSEIQAITLEIETECDRIDGLIEMMRAADLAKLNASVLEIMYPISRFDRDKKIDQSILSYSDLISKTLYLLHMPDQVAWILYKLDEGIDHILLDEVQDTAPAQWKITDAIADEFFSGAGARDVARSIFAVGDKKQSIFSFQGADLSSFEYARNRFRRVVESAGRIWRDNDLTVSFRSTSPILSLVDAVFADGPASIGVDRTGTLHHFVSRQGQAGSVALWPLTKALEVTAPPNWDVPSDYVAATSEKRLLANKIADHIAAEIKNRTVMASRNRAVRAGDYLILVRRRDRLVVEIARACKARNVPVSGLDRLKLIEEQAVSDLLALCDSLLLPSDNHAFAQFLVSPLGNLSDESLMDLALDRRGSLAATLFARRNEREEWFKANEMFQTVRGKIDFISPFALIAMIFGPLGGRARLLQRLGPDAAEPIDELLAEAQTYASAHPASLQQFVFNLRQSGATIKREPEGAGDVVRIMTVHGAKGLQAPVVILPDTTTLPNATDNLFWLTPPEDAMPVPIFCPHKELRCNAVTQAMSDAKQARMEEYNRLLYVALTRAEDHLIVCGAEGKQKTPAESWYNLVKAGFSKTDAASDENGILRLTMPQIAEPDRVKRETAKFHAHLPSWAGCAPSWEAARPLVETKRPEPMAPSRSTEDKEKQQTGGSPLLLNAAKAGPILALNKGKAVHTLLQYLPDLMAAERESAAQRYLMQPALGLPKPVQSQIAQAIFRLFESEAGQELFGSGSRAEVPLAGIVGDTEIGGLIDRLIVKPDHIVLADFKTDRQVPDQASSIPTPYLRQMAAYAAILEQIFPARPIHCHLIWTETADFMPIPSDLISRHAPSPGQPFTTGPAA